MSLQVIFFLSCLFVYKMLFILLPDILLLFGLCMQSFVLSVDFSVCLFRLPLTS